MTVSFESFLQDDKWKTFNEHVSNFSAELDKNISDAATHERKQRKKLRKELFSRFKIKKTNNLLQQKLRKELYSGNVVGVDGTCAEVDLIAGFQAQIGVVAVNYKNDRASFTVSISEPFLDNTIDDVKEQMKHLRLKGAGKIGITPSHITAIMLFKERDFALKRPEKFKMVQGDILPHELRTGQGRLRGLDICLSLGRKLLNEDYIVAVQTSTKRPELRWIGTALDSGEYVQLYDYSKMLDAFLEGDDYTKPANFNINDYANFKDFNQDVKEKFSVGMYKVKKRAYVFYAPKRNFDLMANLIFADSEYQALRGFPLLLDYADIICSRLFSTGDFKKMVNMKLAKSRRLEFEIDERSLRRR